MGLLKKRPDIRLLAPRAVAGGFPFQLLVELDCPEPLDVDAIRVELRGNLVYYTESQYGRHRNVQTFSRFKAELETPDRLPAGVQQHPVVFELPADTPGSYSGRWLGIEYAVHIHVDIPWWPDARANYLLRVTATPPAPDARSAVFVTRTGGPEGRKAYAEVSLATNAVSPGGELRGALALSNVEHNRYRGVSLALVAQETLPAAFMSVRHDTRVRRWRLDLDEPKEGQAIDFRLGLPSDVSPSFQLGDARLRWFLEVEVDVALGRDPKMWIPIEIVGEASARAAALEAAPLAIGADRQRLVWAEVAARTPFELQDDALVASFGAPPRIEVRIQRHHAGRAGARVEAHFDYPNLGLGLDLSGRGDRARLEPRDPSHDESLRSALPAVPARLEEASDTHLRWIQEQAGLELDAMVALVEALAAFAERLHDALETLPLPGPLGDQAGAWTETARRFGARLEAGAARIVGRHEDRTYGLRMRFKGGNEPDHLEAFVAPKIPLDGRHHLEWRAGASSAPLPAALAELATEAERLRIDAQGATVQLAPDTDLDAAMNLALTLDAWAEQLAAPGGGYR